jgi:hypothetical protein
VALGPNVLGLGENHVGTWWVEMGIGMVTDITLRFWNSRQLVHMSQRWCVRNCEERGLCTARPDTMQYKTSTSLLYCLSLQNTLSDISKKLLPATDDCGLVLAAFYQK